MNTIIYKGYEITRQYRDGMWDSLLATYGGEKSVAASSYSKLIQFIDLMWDGKEPEGYFNQYSL